jgi:hypothetical protein
MTIFVLGAGSAIWSELRLLFVRAGNPVLELKRPLDSDFHRGLRFVDPPKDVLLLDLRSPPPSECNSSSVAVFQQSLLQDLFRLRDYLGSSFRLIRFSSGSVYGALYSDFYPTEVTPANPMSFYGELHSRMDRFLLSDFNNSSCIRLPNVILSRPKDHHFQSKILSVRDGDQLHLSDDGSAVRNYVNVRDIFLQIFNGPSLKPQFPCQSPPRILNVNGGSILSTVDFVGSLCRDLSKSCAVVRADKPPIERFRVLESIYKRSHEVGR